MPSQNQPQPIHKSIQIPHWICLLISLISRLLFVWCPFNILELGILAPHRPPVQISSTSSCAPLSPLAHAPGGRTAQRAARGLAALRRAGLWAPESTANGLSRSRGARPAAETCGLCTSGVLRVKGFQLNSKAWSPQDVEPCPHLRRNFNKKTRIQVFAVADHS